MSLIRNRKYFPCGREDAKPLLLMCGLGGSIWQLRRLITVLNKAGYDVTALDFPKSVLASGDETQLPRLVDEVVVFAEERANDASRPVMLAGVSLGALLALNILRRSPLYNRGVLITGGDIAKIAQKLYPMAWSQPYAELADCWKDINMYTPPKALKGKRLLFVIHPSSKLIDAADVYAEIRRQQTAGNHLVMIERGRFDHVGTIIEETVLFPKRTLEYIRLVESGRGS